MTPTKFVIHLSPTIKTDDGQITTKATGSFDCYCGRGTKELIKVLEWEKRAPTSSLPLEEEDKGFVENIKSWMIEKIQEAEIVRSDNEIRN